MAEGLKRQTRIRVEDSEVEVSLFLSLQRLKEEIKEKDKQIKELKLDLQAKELEHTDYTKEQFWRLVVRHEQDIVNFDDEKAKFVELLEEISALKGELKARGEFKIIEPQPDESLIHEYDILQSKYTKLQFEFDRLKKNFDI